MNLFWDVVHHPNCMTLTCNVVLQMLFPFCVQDYDFHKGKSEYEDILQSNNVASSATPRGHQSPAAFLIMASGMDKVRPLQNTHKISLG